MWHHIAPGSRRGLDGLLGGRLSCVEPLVLQLLLVRNPCLYLGDASAKVGIQRVSRTLDLAHLLWLHVVTRRRSGLRSLKVAGPFGEHLHLGHLRSEPWERAQPILGATAIELALKWHASNVVLQASTEGPKMCSAMRTWVRPHAGRLGAAHSPQLATANTCLSVCELPSHDDAPRLKGRVTFTHRASRNEIEKKSSRSGR